jgi:predicted transcriptional regulator
MLSVMEVQFTPEQEARILQIANYNGTPAEQLVKQAALRLVEEDEQFRADIDEAVEQADRGDLISHEEVKARIARSLQSR